MMTVKNRMEVKMNAEIRAENALMKLLENYSLDRITVKMISAEAGITRQTFYYHFLSKQKLAESCLKGRIRQIVRNNSQQNEAWLGVFRDLLQYAVRNRNILLNLYRSAWQDDFEKLIHAEFNDIMAAAVLSCAGRLKIPLTEENCVFVTKVYEHILVGIFIDCMENGLKTDAATVARRLQSVLGGMVERSLRSFQTVRGS